MSDEIEQLLKNLKLGRMRSIYDEHLRAAEKQQVSYSEFVAGLLRAQWHDRQKSALEWRIRRATLPERWSLETFPYTRQPGVKRKQIQGFAELDFVAKRENLVFVGPLGSAKRDSPVASSSRLCRMGCVASSSARRICSMRCTLRSPTAPRASW